MANITYDLGIEIRRRRERLGLSQEELADKAGVHRTYISDIELGKVDISVNVAHKLTKALGLKLSTFFRGIDY